MTYSRTGLSLTTLSLLATALASPALAQGGPGREGRLTYGVGLDYDFEEGLQATSDLSFGITTRTEIETFTFGIGTQLFGDFTDSGTDDFDFRNWNAGLGYTRQGADSALAFNLAYSETDLDDTVDLSGPVPIITQDGSAATLRADAQFQYGINSPFGLTFDLNYRDTDYTGTTDPDLVDETEIGADVLARFSLSPTFAIRARAGINQIDEEDAAGTETETTYVGLGVSSQTAGGLSFTGDILYDESEVTTSSPASSTTDNGIGVDLTLDQARPDGNIGARLSSRIDDTGRRTTARVYRSINTKTGALAFSLGVVDQEGDDQLRVVGDVNYTMSTATGGGLSVSVAKDTVSSSGSAVDTTLIDVDFTQPINPTSSWSASLGYVATDDPVSGDDERTSAGLTYTRNLTPEWDMNTGYRYSRDETGDVDNSVFFNVTRDITFGF